ncbi:protein TIFY 6B-like isoform X2 [Olea europaea var. sylvestris]|uniref:protein TIFY 6B-like isoform X2 n=1 Tax=Olea europaea var. sylvestris TaxID=158386 RepID=UPI000C1CD6BE|nr:protein TIFY 6B-like isoform X2 [Olea europaea var. sylvestris]
MERDFMGLTVKQETPDETMDSGPVRSSAMQWSFPNKVSAVPQLLSFQGAQIEKPKTGFDSLASSGLVTITTTTEAFDSDQKPYSGVMQSLTHSAGTQPLAVPVTNPVLAVPPNSSVVDTSGLRSASKTSGAPAQLTIFYSGSVCVYDNVSPEKAQAIMLLAGNGFPMTSRTTVPAAPSPIKAPVTLSPAVDEFVVTKPYGAALHCSSPISVTSINVSQSAGGLGSNNDLMAIKPAGVGATPNKVEPLKVVDMIGSVPANFLSSGAVPQSRRKSLVRFLERRKERVVYASPYASKQSVDCSAPFSASVSVNSSGSCPVQEIK